MSNGVKLVRDGATVAVVRQLELAEGRCSFVAVGGTLLRPADAQYELVDSSGKVRRIRITDVQVSGGTSSCVVSAELLPSS